VEALGISGVERSRSTTTELLTFKHVFISFSR